LAGAFFICAEIRYSKVRRFFVREIKPGLRSCSLTGSEARHISRVLRMTRGDRLVLMDSKGARFQTVIESVSPKKVVVFIEKSLPPPVPSPVEIVLCQALPRSRAMDYVIQKTSELGVSQIFPFYSERSIVRLGKERLVKKMDHWREITRNSAKQCDRMIPATIGSPLSFHELINRLEGEDALKVILWEKERARDLKGLFRASSPVDKVMGIVGPEGGFSQKEVLFAEAAGFIPVSLGNRVLRSETAAIIMTAIVQYEWGDLSMAEGHLRNP